MNVLASPTRLGFLRQSPEGRCIRDAADSPLTWLICLLYVRVASAEALTRVRLMRHHSSLSVTPVIRACMADEHRCADGTCILMEYVCDNRPDCRDMSDEANCGEFSAGNAPAAAWLAVRRARAAATCTDLVQ